MRWFKHHSDLSQDEGVCRYLDESGRERATAYGFLMFILEAIASRMDASEGHLVCSATYSIRQWQRITYCHSNRVMKYLHLCEVIGWVHVEFGEGTCKVSVPRMVEWRDETTRKSGVLPEEVAQSRVDKSKENKKESRDNLSLSEGSARSNTDRSPPHSFKISVEQRQWAEVKRPDIDIGKETEKFKFYEFPRPKSNWDAAWKKWILGARSSSPNAKDQSDIFKRSEDMYSLAAILGLSRQAGESDTDFLSRIEDTNQHRIRNLDA